MGPCGVTKSIGCGSGERRGGKPDTFIASVKYGVEALEECETRNRTDAVACSCAAVAYNEIYITRNSSNRRVESTWPYLRIRRQLKGSLRERKSTYVVLEAMTKCSVTYTTDCEEQTLKIAELRGRNAQQSSAVVEDTTGGGLIRRKRF